MHSKARNAAGMKSYNRQLILNLIRQEPMSRAEIARRTGLTRAAITNITHNLVAEGLVLIAGTGEADYGRKPILLDINPHAFYAIGLNISRSGSTMGVVNLKGEVLIRRQIDLPATASAYGAMKIMAGEIQKVMDERDIPCEKVLGLGISAPGPIDIHSGCILNPPNFEKWRGMNVVRYFQKAFPFCVFLDNNSAALTLAEKNFGMGKVYGSFMLMVVDTGIGAGIIKDGKLYRGVGGFGSEVGHTSIRIDGRPCSCGSKGCLEVYASIPAVLRKAREADSSIACWRDIIDRAQTGEGFCMKMVDREARYLSTGIVNAMNVLELEAVVLAGDVAYEPRLLLDRIREYTRGSFITRDVHDIPVYATQIVQDAEILSSATIVLDDFFMM